MNETSILTCCAFTGHRPNRFPFRYNEQAPLCKKIKAELVRQSDRLYQEGVRKFWFGGALGVDLWAAEAVVALQQRHRGVSLCCAVPFQGYEDSWHPAGRERLAQVLSICDEVVTVCGRYSPDVYKRRNYYMVDRCQTLVAVFDQDRSVRSGTLQTVNYAKKVGRQIVYIHPDTAEMQTNG